MTLSEWLADRKIKRKDFAASIGVSPSLVTALCAGGLWPGRETAEAISRVTDGAVTANDFMRSPEAAE